MVGGDTIVAVSSPPGGAVRAVIRLSGPRAFAVAGIPRRRGFRRTTLAGIPAGACGFPAPRSYTREDVVEFHLPGASPLVEAAVNALLASGARPARPGEFTQRAYLNGRIDLPAAEAVLDLIDAGNAAEARAALSHPEFSRAVARLEASLLELCAPIEASLDFSDQDLDPLFPDRWSSGVEAVRKEVEALLASTASRRIARDRPAALLFGPPNAGKTSLFNRLGGESAIESDVAGTTRDVLRASLGAVDILDAAGWCETGEDLDLAASRRTEEELERADLVVFVADASDPGPARAPAERAARFPVLGVLNKIDRAAGSPLEPVRDWVRVSARTGEGVDGLRRRILDRLLFTPLSTQDARFHATLRQIGQLRRAREALVRATESIGSEAGWECVCVELRESVESLGLLSGRGVSEAVLDVLFSKFCLGK